MLKKNITEVDKLVLFCLNRHVNIYVNIFTDYCDKAVDLFKFHTI